MRVGFLGTTNGMTTKQYNAVSKYIMSLKPNSGFDFHHGQCIGADKQFHDIIYNNTMATIIIHPPYEKKDVFEVKVNRRIIFLPPKSYLIRNMEIVLASEFLISAPSGMKDIMKSDVWTALKFAKSKMIDFIAILPNGVESKVNKKKRSINDISL